MKHIKKVIFMIFLFIFASSNILALEVCHMSTEYKKWLLLSEEEKEIFDVPPYCEESFIKDNSKFEVKASDKYRGLFSRFIEDLDSASARDSRYNAVEEGLVTPAKDQYGTNSCWAFSGISLVETSALKEGLGTIDLSERHIEYSMTRNAFTDGTKDDGLNRQLDAGGNPYFTSSYFFRHDGPIMESSMPYEKVNTKISKNALPKGKAVLDISDYTTRYYDLTAGCESAQINVIKDKVIKYGSVGVSIYYHDAFLKNSKYYYYNGGNSTNHAVVVVGWDDSIATSAFHNNPSTKGAWIVKNSWGSTYGDNGYFYVSYGDKRVCTNLSTFSGVTVNTYDNAYNAADTLSNLSFTINGNIYASARFSKKSSQKEYLDKVSFEVTTNNNYTVYLSNTNNLTNTGAWITLGSGIALENGVKTVKFSPIEISGDYTVIVKYSNGLFPAMCKTTYSDKDMHYFMGISSGRNYYSNDLKKWEDMSTVKDSAYSGCEPVIYAYTKNANSAAPSFEITAFNGTKNEVYARSDDYYIMNVTSANILSYQMFSLKIYNSKGVDKTGDFEISNTLANGRVTIKPKGTCGADTYILKLIYNGVTKSKSFIIKALVESSKYKIEGDYIIVSLGREKSLSKTVFINNLNMFNNNYKVLDSAGSDITSTTDVVGTNMKINIGGKDFTIVLKGDISGDGQILSNDALLISRHLTYIKRLNEAQELAADISGDGQILSNDALLISRFLVNLRDSL